MVSHDKLTPAQKLQQTKQKHVHTQMKHRKKRKQKHQLKTVPINIWQLAVALNIGRKLASQCVYRIWHLKVN
jgi:hypothetical protein